MFTQIDLSGTPSPLLTATHSTGVRLQGVTSGATGFVHKTLPHQYFRILQLMEDKSC